MFKRTIEEKFGVITFSIAGILIIPQLYFLSNLEEFSRDALLPLTSATIAVCVIILGLCLRIKNKGQYFLCGLGLSILICDQFLRMDITHLDGSSSSVILNPLITSANTLVYVGLPLTLLLVGGRLKKVLIDLTYILILFGIAITSYSFYKSLPSGGNDQTPSLTQVPEFLPEDQRPNVYFLWLDAMQTDYMQRYIKERNSKSSFPGFSLYENNSSNYLYTAQSNISFMSGTIFKGNQYLEWSQNSNKLRQDLKSLGYRVITYAKKDFTSRLDDVTYLASDVFQKQTKTKHPFIQDFISYSIVRILPGVAANQSLKIGRIIGASVAAALNQESEFSTVTSISDGIEPLSGVFTLNRLIEDEASRRSNNELVIAQALIPHGPYVIDKNCGYRGRSTNAVPENYYEQVECSVDLVKKFFDQLKNLKRYHSSIIIIMGDHGSGWASQLEGFKDGESPLNQAYTPWSKSMVISRASALLMIKPHDTSEENTFKTTTKESQLVDIYPTLLNLLGAKDKLSGDLDGIDLNSPVDVVRDKYITYFKPSQTINPYIAEIYDLHFDGKNRQLSYRSRFLVEQDLPAVRCDEVIDFSSIDQDSQVYFSTGLSHIEHWGRWSNKESVTIKFNAPNKEVCKITDIVFKLRGLVTQGHPKQEAEVSYNGRSIKNIKINLGESNPAIFSLNLPQSAAKPGDINTIKFTFKNSISPKELGLSPDTRKIGLGFESMSFE